jgi:hypothetical protein
MKTQYDDLLEAVGIKTYEDFKKFCQDGKYQNHYPAVYKWVIDSVPEEWCLKILEAAR